jgi:hypothetical protein
MRQMAKRRNLLHVGNSPGRAPRQDTHVPRSQENYLEGVDVGLIMNILIGAGLLLRASKFRIMLKPVRPT